MYVAKRRAKPIVKPIRREQTCRRLGVHRAMLRGGRTGAACDRAEASQQPFAGQVILPDASVGHIAELLCHGRILDELVEPIGTDDLGEESSCCPD